MLRRHVVSTCRWTVSDEGGMTTLELITMLSISMALATVLVPVIQPVLRRAEKSRAQYEMLAIAFEINQELNDLNFGNGFTIDGSRNGTQVQLLVSDGDTPRELLGAGSNLWQRPVNNATGLTDFLERHMATNNPRGNSVNAYPVNGNEWRGAYLTAPIDADSWGNRYAVNADYLDSDPNDVVVLSAGPNEVIETAWTGNPLAAGGDDLIQLVQP
jgi:hypothetical protein